jgi:hypothetical protein
MLPDQCSSCLALPQICEVCSNGETECAHYVLQNGACQIEICPAAVQPVPTPAPPQPGPCSTGGACSPGEGCGTGAAPGSNECSTTCNCNADGYFDCTESCPPMLVDAGVSVGPAQ